MTIASLWVVIKGAGDEPYMVFHLSDAIVQVGVGALLMLVWCAGIAVLVILVRRSTIAKPWLAMILWAAVCLLYLGQGITGYLADIERLAVR